jgi:hypothetical protein
MTIPFVGSKMQLRRLTDYHPRHSNPRCGFELMKSSALAPRGCSGSTQKAPPHLRIVNPVKAARAVRSSCAVSSPDLIRRSILFRV